ncbi:MAG: DNA replication/repair protein RecF [Candidatus Dormibacteraeota bacterium]|nr:DNA replication/repair protein RecF [Candidatus Dormibacteraeota bacterium]
MSAAVMTGARCAISRLRLYRFRNYQAAVVGFGPSLNVIFGSNAQGKTNLLEAVATLTLTRSPRAASSADLIMWGSTECAVEAAVDRPSGDSTLGLRLLRTDEATRVSRTTTIDGKARSARGILGVCPVVLFWPEDLQLVKAGPDGRRRLLDTLLGQLDSRAAAHLLRYRRVLEQRNALLHRIRLDGHGAAALPGFTEELAHHGAHVVVARRSLLVSLAPVATDVLRDLSAGGERLDLRYAPSFHTTFGDADAVERDLREALRRRADEERARGITVVGPHRDDVEVVLDDRPARTAASQGQQRSIVLAWKVAEMRHIANTCGATPVVLLDDVLSELDRQRRADLISLLSAHAGQILVTTTEPVPGLDVFGSVRRFEVRSGTIVEASHD